MKKLFSVIMLIILLFSFSACSNNTNYELEDDEYLDTTEEQLPMLEWPDNELALLIPLPPSEYGEVEWEESDEVNICVYEISKDEYSQYIKDCAEAGFSIVTSEDDDSYYANNSDGYRLSLYYDDTETTMDITVEEPLHTVQFEIDCYENWFFDKYDVLIEVDWDELGVLKHGESNTFTAELEKGSYTITFTSEEDDEITGTADFEITGNRTLRYEISCKSDRIEVENVAEISVPISSDDLGEKQYDEVKKLFKDAGFTNIEFNEVKDLPVEDISKSGIVSSITINGNNQFSKEDSFFPEAEIVIEYHSALEISPSKDAHEYWYENYEDVKNELASCGFTNIRTQSTVESSFWGNETGDVYSVSIGGYSSFDSDWSFKPDAEVIIKYYIVEESTGSSKSTTELSQYYAKKAFEEYGESQYPFGFKCHWIMDLINAEQYSDGSWFFKVGVTIKTIYGTEFDTIAEGMVSGSDAYPTVIQFYVSNP